MTSQTRNTIFVCLISGIVCGLLAASQCPARHPGTLWILREDPVADSCKMAPASFALAPWVLWLHWINWVPGLLYGLLYAAANVRNGPTEARVRVILYGMASGAIYLLAGLVFARLLASASRYDVTSFFAPFEAGLAAGFVGGLALAVATRLVSGSPVPGKRVLTRPWMPSLVGAAMGLVFVLFVYGNAGQQWLFWPVGFALWQVPVGFVISRGMQHEAAAKTKNPPTSP